jgi:hypothetical protein
VTSDLPNSAPIEAAMALASGGFDVPVKIFTVLIVAAGVSPASKPGVPPGGFLLV